MKWSLLVVLAGAMAAGGAGPVLQKGDLVALCGDSITRRMGYTVMVQDYLLMCAPTEDVNTVQFGRGFEKANGFRARMEADVRPFHPQVVTLCYGMNDGDFSPSKPATVETYGKALEEVVQKLRAAGVRQIVIASPPPVDPAAYKQSRSTAAEYNQTLADLAAAARRVAAEQAVMFADVNGALTQAMANAKAKFGADYRIAPDGIHPNPNGHLVMASVLLKAMGFDGNIGTVTVDFASGRSDCDAAQKILSCKEGAVELESNRYPFCMTGIPEDTSAWAMSELVPFHKELNRYMLVVKNAPAKARVTWGKVSKEFTKVQLEAGINLAAEFQDNPFKEAFFKVDRAVKEQQKFEAEKFKELTDAEAKGEATLQDESGAVVPVRDYMLKKDSELRAASRASVLPVKHVIRIEAAP